MYDQLAHLADMADRAKVTIQVVPGEVGAHVGLLGAFAIASVDGPGYRLHGVTRPGADHRDAIRGREG